MSYKFSIEDPVKIIILTDLIILFILIGALGAVLFLEMSRVSKQNSEIELISDNEVNYVGSTDYRVEILRQSEFEKMIVEANSKLFKVVAVKN